MRIWGLAPWPSRRTVYPTPPYTAQPPRRLSWNYGQQVAGKSCCCKDTVRGMWLGDIEVAVWDGQSLGGATDVDPPIITFKYQRWTSARYVSARPASLRRSLHRRSDYTNSGPLSCRNSLIHCVHKNVPPFYFWNNSVKNKHISIIFGTQTPEETWH